MCEPGPAGTSRAQPGSVLGASDNTADTNEHHFTLASLSTVEYSKYLPTLSQLAYRQITSHVRTGERGQEGGGG